MRDYVWRSVCRHGTRPAVIADGTTWTYADLHEAVMALAGHLGDLGVGPGDPVAMILRNSVEYVITDLAVALLGAAKVPLNLMLSEDEQVYILTDCQPVACVAEEEHLGAVRRANEAGVSPHLVTVRGKGGAGSWTEVLRHEPLTEEPDVGPEDLAMVMYTGGTTGRPKGVMHTQRGLAANLLSHVIEMELVATDVLLLTSPLPHSAGFLLQTALVKGAEVILHDRFDVDEVLDRIERDGASYLFMVPTMIYRLLDALEAREDFDSSSVRTIMYGAAPITVARLEQGLRLLGPVFMQIYAQSEAPNFLTRLRRDDHHATGPDAHRLRSCGQSVTMAQVAIVDDDGSPCPAGVIGEVVAQTPYTMKGYLGKDTETSEALREGWLYTGDVGYLDEEGYLYLVDRKKDMIITGGLNVYSSEVEQALASVAGVKESAVTGIPHPDWGEAVVAFVVPTDPEVTPDSVQAAVRGALTSYKRPKRVVLVDTLPVTAVGKINKVELREGWDQW
nr:AMP-binding protein [Ornithinimicrobium sp. HY1745]